MDSLTLLLSRGCYEKCLERLRYRTAILLFDVDDFKEINDTYGHQCGDEVLKTIASVIRKTYSRIGCCYRIGGDEFCVILNRGRLEELPDSMEEYIHPETGEVMEMAAPPSSLQFINGTFDRLLREARQGNPILPEVSLGYVFYNGKENIETVVKQADELMYKKKQIRKAQRRREKEK